MKIYVKPRSVLVIAICIVFILVLAHSVSYHLQQQVDEPLARYHRFLLDSEGNVPTWFSSMLLLCCSMILGSIASHLHRRGDIFRKHWTALAIIFFGLSFDEVASFHELVSRPVRAVISGLPEEMYYAWVIPAGASALIVGIIYARLLLNLPRATAGLILMAGGLFLSGAIGLEVIGSAMAEQHGFDSFEYFLSHTIEEMLEMVGVSVFLFALLQYAAGQDLIPLSIEIVPLRDATAIVD